MPLNNLFTYNEAYYLSQNPDVAAAVRAGVFSSGLQHWQLYGSMEGRNASRFFDWQLYRDNNPDLAEAGITSRSQVISHFNQYGFSEGRSFLKASLFDYQYYADHNPDLAAAGITSKVQLEVHFRTHGVYEGRAASSLINGASYIDLNPDLKALLEAGGNINGYTIANKDKAGVFHYYNWGLNEGRPLGAPRVDDPLPAVNSTTPIWSTDTNGDGIYNAGDVIHIKLSEAVSTASAFDLHLGSGRSLAGTTFSPVGASGGYASEFQILLNAGAMVGANDVLILGRQSVIDQQGQKPVGDLLFVLPKLPQPAPAMPAFSLSIDVFGDSNVNSAETSSMTGINALVTSSSLASLVVSGLRQGSAHQESAIWNSSTELYEFDATQFDDGVLTVLARDIYGQSQSFSLTKDATAPLLSGSSPLDNATGVAVGANIQLTFNEDVQLGTVGLISLYKSDNTLIESFNVATDLAGKVSVANGAVTINPTADLDAGTGYYLDIDYGALRDLVGNAYAGISSSSTLNFTTALPTLLGTPAADTLVGTAVSDIIQGLAGRDDLTGNGGADIFVFANTDSGLTTATADVIQDFLTGTDRLQLSVAATSLNFQTYGYSTSAGDDLTVEGAITRAENNVFPIGGMLTPPRVINYAWIYDPNGGTAGYLVVTTNSDTVADFVIKFVGLNTSTSLLWSDITT